MTSKSQKEVSLYDQATGSRDMNCLNFVAKYQKNELFALRCDLSEFIYCICLVST